MNNELMHRARALLALRDKATLPVGNMTGADGLTKKLNANRDFLNAAHDMADTIRALLAEVERLQSRLRELANAEPVIFIDGIEVGGRFTGWLKGRATRSDLLGVELIRRPEMPS